MARLANPEIAALFNEMADLTEIAGGDSYRISSFRRAARIIENLPEPAEQMLRFGTLDKRHGIGPGSVHRIKAILRTGTCDDLRQLRGMFPSGLREVLKVKGVGPKTIRKLHRNLGISNLAELEYAARYGAIRQVPRMGEGTIQRILKGIEDYHKRSGKTPLSQARRLGMAIVDELRDVPGAQRVELAGSCRRGKAMTGDLDVLVATDEGVAVVSRFLSLPQIDDVLIRGTGRCMVRLVTGQQMDLRVLAPEEFGAGMHYFTGSKLHNIAVRIRANQRGLKISDHGIFKRPEETIISSGEHEEEIFRVVDLPWIPPELRENTGEIQAADEGKLPRLVERAHLRGDLHMHTTDSDGADPLRAMVNQAVSLGLEYIAITDHSSSMSITKGLDERRLMDQVTRIRALRHEYPLIRVLAGIEVDILPDGSLDLDPEVLRELDWVIGSVHLHTNMSEGDMTRRVIRAMESGVVDCIGHPTGRRPGRREGYPMDMDQVLRAARKTGVAMECNGGPSRMDLPDILCRQARELGVPVVLSTDAHAARHIAVFDYCLAMARRGWLEPRHILNTRPVTELIERRRERLSTGTVVVSGLRPKMEVDETQEVEHDPDANAWEGEAEVEAIDAGVEAFDPDVALDETPLGDAIVERLQRYMQGAVDPSLQKSLERRGDNAMQVAFNLLFQSRS